MHLFPCGSFSIMFPIRTAKRIGIPDDKRIITMLADDTAHNLNNNCPTPFFINENH